MCRWAAEINISVQVAEAGEEVANKSWAQRQSGNCRGPMWHSGNPRVEMHLLGCGGKILDDKFSLFYKHW